MAYQNVYDSNAAYVSGSAQTWWAALNGPMLATFNHLTEQKFRTLKDADNRAIGGLSMGGGQTVAIGFANPDKFHSIVVMSAGGQNLEQNYPDFFKDPAATNKKLKLLWVGIGKDDKLVMAGNNALKESLTKGGIKHTYRETEGRHEWVVWRHHLREVAPLLFK